MTEKTTGCGCSNCGTPSCQCNAMGARKDPNDCCCGPTCTCGPNCNCPPSCNCPANRAKK